MNRHIASSSTVVLICEQLAHEVLQSKSSLLEDSGFSILGENNILRRQGCCRANRNPFLSGRNLSVPLRDMR